MNAAWKKALSRLAIGLFTVIAVAVPVYLLSETLLVAVSLLGVFTMAYAIMTFVDQHWGLQLFGGIVISLIIAAVIWVIDPMYGLYFGLSAISAVMAEFVTERIIHNLIADQKVADAGEGEGEEVFTMAEFQAEIADYTIDELYAWLKTANPKFVAAIDNMSNQIEALSKAANNKTAPAKVDTKAPTATTAKVMSGTDHLVDAMNHMLTVEGINENFVRWLFRNLDVALRNAKPAFGQEFKTFLTGSSEWFVKTVPAEKQSVKAPFAKPAEVVKTSAV